MLEEGGGAIVAVTLALLLSRFGSACGCSSGSRTFFRGYSPQQALETRLFSHLLELKDANA